MSNIFKNIKEVPVGILSVFISTLLVAISTTAAFSVTPFFLRDILNVNLLTIGLMESVTETLAQLARLFSGVISDKLRRYKPMFFLGTIFSFIAKPLLICANGSGMVLASKVADRLGNGFSASPRDSYIAINSSSDKKGAYIGLGMTFKTLGCVLGPWIVMLITLMYPSIDIRLLMSITSIPCLFAVYFTYKYMKEATEEDKTDGISRKSKVFVWAKIVQLPASFWFFIFIMAIFMLARIPECYLLLNLKDSGLPMWFCSGAIGFFNIVSTFVSYPVGALSDKYRRTIVLLLSFLALAASLFFLSLSSAVCGVLGVICWGLQRSSSQIISVACISDFVDKSIIGTAIGLLSVVNGLSATLVGIFAGACSLKYGISLTYTVATCVSLAATVMLVFFIIFCEQRKKKRRHS